MAGLNYQHIGHDPKLGPIALWSLDQTGKVHEDRRVFDGPDAEWLDWSHEKCFQEVKSRIMGRVELSRQAGSIHISDPQVCRSDDKLCRILDALDRAYPKTRWYVFGAGFKGESAVQILARQARAA